MDLRPVDRRGLGETIAWASALTFTSILLAASLFKTGHFDPTILGFFGGLIAAVMARGAQSSAERSSRDDLARQLDESARAAAMRSEDSARRAQSLADRVEEMHTQLLPPQDKKP